MTLKVQCARVPPNRSSTPNIGALLEKLDVIDTRKFRRKPWSRGVHIEPAQCPALGASAVHIVIPE